MANHLLTDSKDSHVSVFIT